MAEVAQTNETTPPTDQSQQITPPQQTNETAPQKTLLNQDQPTEPPKAPEKPDGYGDFTLPDGFEANPEVLGKAKTIFHELGLPKESAQKLVDFYSEQIKSTVEAPMNFWRETREKWVGEIKADPQIGGPKLDATRQTISKAIDLLGPDLGRQFREAMDFTGAGDNPAFVRAMAMWASKLTEAGAIQGTKPTPPPNSRPNTIAAAFYPNLPTG